MGCSVQDIPIAELCNTPTTKNQMYKNESPKCFLKISSLKKSHIALVKLLESKTLPKSLPVDKKLQEYEKDNQSLIKTPKFKITCDTVQHFGMNYIDCVEKLKIKKQLFCKSISSNLMPKDVIVHADKNKTDSVVSEVQESKIYDKDVCLIFSL